jgi:alkylation response protein AidB-like acyl-CoA dehydrogenase
MNAPENSWVARAAAAAQTQLAAHAADVDRHARWPAEGVAALAKNGLLGLTVPHQYGGAQEGPATFATVTRLLAEGCPSTAMIYLMHVCATQVMVAANGFTRRDAVLRDIAAGRHLSTLAFSEKGSRSHFWAPVSQAEADGSSHRLTAQKSWVTSAGHADSYIVSTRALGRSEPPASTLYYVAGDSAGLTVDGTWDGLGLRGNASAPMRLEGVSVPLAARVSGDGDGFTVMIQTVLPWFQLGSAAVSVGIARAATDDVRRHLLTSRFEHLGETLGSLPNLRARLAQMQVSVDVQQAFLEHAAARMSAAAADALLAILECKAAAAEAALHVTDLAMRACGGAAFSRHLAVERNFRDARAAAVMAPTTDVLHDFIGKAVLGLPLF